MPSEKRERQRAGREARREAARAAQRRAQRRRQIIAVVSLIAVVFGIGILVNLGGDDDDTDVTAGDEPGATTTTEREPLSFGDTECPPAEGATERTTTFEGPFENCLDDGKDYTATIEFDVGVVEVDLAEEESPVTVNNFVALARHRFYEEVVCHRVIKGFVVQCGDPDGTGSGGPGYTIGEEPPASGTYEIGQLAMAKTQAPESTGSQFFIITGDDGASLPPQYSLLGTITAGLEVAKAIEADGADADPAPPAVVHKMLKVTIKES